MWWLSLLLGLVGLLFVVIAKYRKSSLIARWSLICMMRESRQDTTGGSDSTLEMIPTPLPFAPGKWCLAIFTLVGLALHTESVSRAAFREVSLTHSETDVHVEARKVLEPGVVAARRGNFRNFAVSTSSLEQQQNSLLLAFRRTCDDLCIRSHASSGDTMHSYHQHGIASLSRL